uniref:NB-ARC domain-containing protein n=1 Tax=Trypanosoma congolense (strain IL3000) TaxID=1068625 RepID=G0UIR7_TRYCI|nr:conserved hypothetical protein [Trypanosoma congolense IL3000]
MLRRLYRHVCVRPSGIGFMFASEASGTTGRAAASAFDGAPQADPILFDVPMVARVIGREAEIMHLWQGLLAGRRRQVITGPDGIGKSTVAAEFCSRARRSGRFTCIHWFDWCDSVQSRIAQFFRSMKGRKEKDVLLVVDGVVDLKLALQTLPDHPSVYVLLTTPADASSDSKVSVLKTLPLTVGATEQFSQVVTLEGVASAHVDVLHAVGRVPLLMHVACSLMEHGAITPEALQRELVSKGVGAEDTISVSHVLRVLLDVALKALELDWPGGTKQLQKLALLDIHGIHYSIVDSIVGDGRGEKFAMLLSSLGVCGQRWEEPSLFVHSCVAQVLRHDVESGDLAQCAEVLLSLWPRRWRSVGSGTAYELVRHTAQLLSCFDARGLPLSDGLLLGLDRCATFLAHSEGKDLKEAAEFWMRVVSEHQKEGECTAEAVRVGRECGRLLHFLRDKRAADVLRYTYDLAVTVHGKQSPEAALILGCYAPYLSPSRESVQLLGEAATVLKTRVGCSEAALGREEEHMVLETVFVLLMCQGQILQELGEVVPESLWDALQGVEEVMRRSNHRGVR